MININMETTVKNSFTGVIRTYYNNDDFKEEFKEEYFKLKEEYFELNGKKNG